MKVEKIHKHMIRRTVVVKTNAPITVGVITKLDNGDNTVIVSGYTPEDGDHDYNWAGFDLVRKATDDERAAFFAWLREDGRDTTDGFKRFGGAPRGWSATTPVGRTVFNVATPNDRRAQAVGKRVRCIDKDGDEGRMGTCVSADNTRLPYLVKFDDGESRYVYAVEVIDDAPIPSTPKRLTEGDSAITVYDDGRAVMGKITRDDHDSTPYIIDGKYGCFSIDRTHPLTLDGFRAAAAQQRAAGVTFEEGDYAALIDDEGDVRVGAILVRTDGLVCLHYAFATAAALNGIEDWSDRVIVLTKRPQI